MSKAQGPGPRLLTLRAYSLEPVTSGITQVSSSEMIKKFFSWLRLPGPKVTSGSLSALTARLHKAKEGECRFWNFPVALITGKSSALSEPGRFGQGEFPPCGNTLETEAHFVKASWMGSFVLMFSGTPRQHPRKTPNSVLSPS